MERIAKPARHLGTGLLATGIAFCLMLLLTVAAFASTVHVYDQARVLNASQVQSAAQSLPYPMDIYTTNTYNGNSSSFIQQTRSHITSANLIVMAIDTAHHYVAIEGGSSVPLSNSQYSSAVNAFTSNYSSGGYTGATIAAINSLRSSLGSSSSSSSGVPASSGGGWNFGLGTLCCVGLLILAAIALFSVFRRRRRGFFGQPQPPMGGPYQQGYPPNYYGPGYNQGPGMNPWVAGGLGAAAGGLAGYELGKEVGEREREGQGGNFGNEGNFGGGAADSFGNDDNFGGGAGGSFGGDDFGAGGGGAGGDFGGNSGGDFGGGGAGSF